ncbi:unnamed protein product [Closterium sp. Naga37s-1]|nr:unnamed protein product [Closterium sp. Naga37s-1]
MAVQDAARPHKSRRVLIVAWAVISTLLNFLLLLQTRNPDTSTSSAISGTSSLQGTVPLQASPTLLNSPLYPRGPVHVPAEAACWHRQRYPASLREAVEGRTDPWALLKGFLTSLREAVEGRTDPWALMKCFPASLREAVEGHTDPWALMKAIPPPSPCTVARLQIEQLEPHLNSTSPSPLCTPLYPFQAIPPPSPCTLAGNSSSLPMHGSRVPDRAAGAASELPPGLCSEAHRRRAGLEQLDPHLNFTSPPPSCPVPSSPSTRTWHQPPGHTTPIPMHGDAEDRLHVLPYFRALQDPAMGRRQRRVYLDLGGKEFNSSVLWMLRHYPLDFTELHVFEVKKGLFLLPHRREQDDEAQYPEILPRKRLEKVSVFWRGDEPPPVPNWMVDRIHIYNDFVDNTDYHTGTRLIKVVLVVADSQQRTRCCFCGTLWPRAALSLILPFRVFVCVHGCMLSPHHVRRSIKNVLRLTAGDSKAGDTPVVMCHAVAPLSLRPYATHPLYPRVQKHVNITRFIKDVLRLTAGDTLVVKMDIEGKEWDVLPGESICVHIALSLSVSHSTCQAHSRGHAGGEDGHRGQGVGRATWLTAGDTLVVKMDIEGKEWDVLPARLQDPGMPEIVDEISVEVHYAPPSVLACQMALQFLGHLCCYYAAAAAAAPSMLGFGWRPVKHTREEATQLLLDLPATSDCLSHSNLCFNRSRGEV